ncbi:GDCCVxC domain-containing (seleno)protein [Flavivirga algicola]|uniref:GDCCVxC domain-containing (seleno)protein n=1 Tax=Flavivirga algicola TaxID=2729136 RepID=UPI0037442941
MSLKTTISCPYCHHKMTTKMSQTSIHYLHECNNCFKVLRVPKDNCCIFCSYGTRKCPSAQKAFQDK